MSGIILDLKSDKDFDHEVATAQGLVILDFYADWCNPCKAQTPILEKFAAEYPNEIKIIKINIEELTMLSTNFQIKSIPTLVLLKDGKIVDQKIGLQDKEALTNWLNDNQ